VPFQVSFDRRSGWAARSLACSLIGICPLINDWMRTSGTSKLSCRVARFSNPCAQVVTCGRTDWKSVLRFPSIQIGRNTRRNR